MSCQYLNIKYRQLDFFLHHSLFSAFFFSHPNKLNVLFHHISKNLICASFILLPGSFNFCNWYQQVHCLSSSHFQTNFLRPSDVILDFNPYIDLTCIWHSFYLWSVTKKWLNSVFLLFEIKINICTIEVRQPNFSLSS